MNFMVTLCIRKKIVKMISLLISKIYIFVIKRLVIADVLQQAACLVADQTKVTSFANLFDCMTLGRASD